jgi:hypothetical protein
MDDNWIYDKIFQQPKPGLFQEEHIEYVVVGKRIKKTTITRKFYGDNDYQDSVKTEIIGIVE